MMSVVESDPNLPVHHWRVYCLDLQTGKILWQRQAHVRRCGPSDPSQSAWRSHAPDGRQLGI
jgi:hypothetical protein